VEAVLVAVVGGVEGGGRRERFGGKKIDWFFVYIAGIQNFNFNYYYYYFL
jgi:hypothetical protein